VRNVHIDPFLFTDEAVSDETRQFNSALQETLRTMPTVSSQTPDDVRAARRAGQGPWGPVVHSDHARTITIDGPGGGLDLRIVEVGEPKGVYLHIHGGGWVLGAADLSDVGNEAMARNADVVVVSVDYRLAPEHPYPAAIEDCTAAASWLIDHCANEFRTEKLTIGGESAGANLVAATLLRTRDDVGYTGWQGANLVYGVYLPPGTPSVEAWSKEGLILDPDTMSWFIDHYVSGPEIELLHPALSPLHGDLADMPPALFTIGTWDPLVDDTLFMASRWAAAGNETELAVYPGGIHAFDAFPTSIALEARDRMHRFIRSAVS
jgi:acetyl esterase/lipase